MNKKDNKQHEKHPEPKREGNGGFGIDLSKKSGDQTPMISGDNFS